jgi:hypothetical protein
MYQSPPNKQNSPPIAPHTNAEPHKRLLAWLKTASQQELLETLHKAGLGSSPRDPLSLDETPARGASPSARSRKKPGLPRSPEKTAPTREQQHPTRPLSTKKTAR